ncbi:MAG: hypothetical protein AB8H80_19120 [Planctomycetota bacterium]
MSRWFWWFLLAPQTYLAAGLAQDMGLPTFEIGAALCLYLGWFARRSALPWLLLGCAISRALVDEASLPVQILVLGIPVCVLLPLRTLFVAQRWLWQAAFAVLLAYGIPWLAGTFGRLFQEPSLGAQLHGWPVVWSAVFVPPLVWLLRHIPPFVGFTEPEPVFGGTRR